LKVFGNYGDDRTAKLNEFYGAVNRRAHYYGDSERSVVPLTSQRETGARFPRASDKRVRDDVKYLRRVVGRTAAAAAAV